MRSIIAGLALAAMASTQAFAGGFALREQSAEGLGAAFAGVAAGGGTGASSMFWNPATMTQHAAQGLLSDSDTSLILPQSRARDGGPAKGAAAPGISDSGNIGRSAPLPASYWLYGLNDRFVVGLSMNSPFAMTTDSDVWYGSPHGDRSKIRTYTFTPSAAFKLSDSFSIGAGLQAEYMNVDLTSSTPAGVKFFDASAHDVDVGFTLGMLFEPTDTTSIGIGYRSSISHALKGDATIISPLGVINPDIVADFKSPETVSVGLRQKLTQNATLLTGAEWANWSRFKDLTIKADPSGTTLGSTKESWKDSWMVSLGGEYAFDDKLTLRAGLAYEKSPVPDATRTPRVPDNDRIWLAMGATYAISNSTSISAAYSHVFMKDGKVNLAGGGGLPPLAATFKQNIDMVSLSITHDW